MRWQTVLRRRLRQHPSALAAVVATVLVSLLVVAALRTFAAGIADASVRESVAVADPTRRDLTVTLPLRGDKTAGADAAVRDAAGTDAIRYAGVATSRGLAGGAASDRIQLTDIPDLARHARLVDGAWPRPAAAAGDVLDVVLPQPAATALGLKVGSRAELSDLIDSSTEPIRVRVSGLFAVSDPDDALWRLVPLALTGTERGDYAAYGPVVPAPGMLTRQLTGHWLIDVPPASLDAGNVAAAAARSAAALDRLAKAPALTGATVRSEQVAVLREAADLGTRTGRVLLTPLVLLLLLGGAALALATTQLGMLRDPETRLLRARGAGTGQLLGLALAEGALVVALSALGGAALAPLLVRPLARAAGFPQAGLGYRDGLSSPHVWSAVAVGAVLALLVFVVASLRQGHLRVERDSGGRGRVLALLAGAGLDLVLLLLAGLGLMQLRRYQNAAVPSLDPLTIAAPALIVAGLAVLALRLIPVLARVAAHLAARSTTLPRAWAGWQVARRIGGQTGSILLVLLALTMGSMAVSQRATTERSLRDQSAFEAGAQLRVRPGGELVGTAPWLSSRLATIAGGPERVMAAHRESVDVGGVRGVTLLGVDVAAAAVMAPRADLVPGGSWSSLTGRLETSTDLGVPVPGTPTTLTLTTQLRNNPRGIEGPKTQVVIADAAGQWWSLRLPIPVEQNARTEVSLRADQGTIRYPVRLVAVTMSEFWYQYLAPAERPTLSLTRVEADGDVVPGAEALSGAWRGATYVVAAPIPTPDPVPVVITGALADQARMKAGSTFALPLSGSTRAARVVGIIDALPTATRPTLGVLADLATLQAAAGAALPNDPEGLRILTAGEFWLDPSDPAAARTRLADEPRLAAEITDRETLLAGRRAGSVNSGMRTAMGLLTIAALVLAALGFAAATTALRGARQHDGVILTALGFGPRGQRVVLLLERTLVIVLAAIVGLATAGLAAWLVVPLLVAGDGHATVPPVVTELNWPALALISAGVAALLIAIAAALVRNPSDIGAALRTEAHE